MAEHGYRAGQKNTLERGCKGEGRQDDLVARLDAEPHERDQQRRRARAAGDRMADADLHGQARLQFADLRSRNKLAVLEYLRDARQRVDLQFGPIRSHVNEGDGRSCHGQEPCFQGTSAVVFLQSALISSPSAIAARASTPVAIPDTCPPTAARKAAACNVKGSALHGLGGESRSTKWIAGPPVWE